MIKTLKANRELNLFGLFPGCVVGGKLGLLADSDLSIYEAGPAISSSHHSHGFVG